MGIFRRPRETSAATPASIGEFWEWWERARPQIEASISASAHALAVEEAAEPGEAGDAADGLGDAAGEGLPAELVEELSNRVRRIHPDLQWEIGGGDDDHPTLTVTGAGDPELRGLAERWCRAAPRGKAAGGWRFFPARQADPEMLEHKLVLGDHEFDLDYVKLGMRADTARARVHISAYHPDFLFVSEEQRAQVAAHVLDWSLGEDDVARWIGDVAVATEPPVDALPPSMLRAVVEQVAQPFEEPTWLTGESRTPRGHPALLGARFPLHRQDYPLCDLHVAVTVPYRHSNPDRLPVEPSAGALRDFEKKLGSLGERAVLAVRETGDGMRVFHLYADPDSGVIAELDQLAAGWPEGKARVESASDPGWRALAPYRP